jgi:hypothetical protein
MRLLRAELGKLNRPLMWGVAITIGVFSVLLAAGGSNNSHRDLASSADQVPSCIQMALPEGPACTRAQALQRSRIEQDRLFRLASARRTAAQLNPVAAGAEAAGLMASLPGALALALLAGGHLGSEYSGRTLKNLLTQHGRRWQVLAAKLVSLWLAAVALVAVCWAALAVAGPILTHANHPPDPHQSLVEAAKWAGSQAARSLLVLAAFAVIGVLAAVFTRNTIGTMATTAAAFVAMLVLASLQSRAGGRRRRGCRAGWASRPGSGPSLTCPTTSGRGSSTRATHRRRYQAVLDRYAKPNPDPHLLRVRAAFLQVDSG